MMNVKILRIIFTTLCMHQCFASNTISQDIKVNDDGSINVQPASGHTPANGEILELGKCARQGLETPSFPILQNMPIIQRLPEPPTNQRPSKPWDEMSLDELQAIINNPNSDGDLKALALRNFEVRELLHNIRTTSFNYNGQKLMDGLD